MSKHLRTFLLGFYTDIQKANTLCFDVNFPITFKVE